MIKPFSVPISCIQQKAVLSDGINARFTIAISEGYSKIQYAAEMYKKI